MTTKLIREQTTAHAFKSQRLSVPVPYSALGAAVIALMLLALAVYVGVRSVGEGSQTSPVTVATPAVSIPANIAPSGPRRQYAPMPPTAEASGRAETLRLCEASAAYYKARPDYVCTGSCTDGTGRCVKR
jgi:hypothetical protein